ncbi:MAG: HlyD family efflux transporter periplasmic adaptor subunit [Mucilaginibacter polytrichastri]|nr:HlyD family efflux transporter periplasmic adaptor subunit [Mucilaginibacter polytrichastri]
MDRVIQKKKWNSKRLLTIGGIAGLIILITASVLLTSGKSRLNVESERITISEIKKGAFQEFIPVNGVVMPLTSIYLDASEGGRVEEKYVEDGAIMKKGQPILKLSNTDLELSLVQQETGVLNLITQMQISKNNAQQNTVSRLNTMADAESAFKEAERLYNLNKSLYSQKAIGLQEFEKSRIDYEYRGRVLRLARQILKQDTVSIKQQNSQDVQAYARTKQALDVMRHKVGDLIVRAPVDGQLTSLDAEIGQNKNKGERLGQLDVIGGFKIRADIDEHYITRIFNGLQGDFQIGEKIYKLKIRKVFSQVTNGRFQVDMEFVGAVPKDIRRGQTLQVRLALGDETQAILLAKGGFYQQTGGNWIFKVSEDGKTAFKADIQLGRQNPDYYEVTSGLNPGDKVVTSSYENYGDIQELKINQ